MKSSKEIQLRIKRRKRQELIDSILRLIVVTITFSIVAACVYLVIR